MGRVFCPVCSRAYASLENLYKHMAVKHPRHPSTRKVRKIVLEGRRELAKFEKKMKKTRKKRRRK